MADDVAISVKHLSKTFRLAHEKHTTLKQNAVNIFGGRSYTQHKALNDVSFEVKDGEFFGIVGRNGSGKSTLLKTLAGIYVPTAGTVEVNRPLSPFIELGVGFNPELTARENIFLNGVILGLSRAQVAEKFDEIVAFAELEEFIDQKLKNYSSGMQVRLAFSIAIQAQAGILLIDEVLAVGDTNFQAKCFEIFRELKRKKTTIVYVSHDMATVRDFCDRVILIHEGKLVNEGKPETIINNYFQINSKDAEQEQDRRNRSKGEDGQRWGNGDATISGVHTVMEKKKRSAFSPNQPIGVSFDVSFHKSVESPIAGMIIKTSAGLPIFATNTKVLDKEMGSFKKGDSINVTWEVDGIFTNGTYLISPAVADRNGKMFYDWIEDAYAFRVDGYDSAGGLVHPTNSVTIEKK